MASTKRKRVYAGSSKKKSSKKKHGKQSRQSTRRNTKRMRTVARKTMYSAAETKRHDTESGQVLLMNANKVRTLVTPLVIPKGDKEFQREGSSISMFKMVVKGYVRLASNSTVDPANWTVKLFVWEPRHDALTSSDRSDFLEENNTTRSLEPGQIRNFGQIMSRINYKKINILRSRIFNLNTNNSQFNRPNSNVDEPNQNLNSGARYFNMTFPYKRKVTYDNQSSAVYAQDFPYNHPVQVSVLVADNQKPDATEVNRSVQAEVFVHTTALFKDF